MLTPSDCDRQGGESKPEFDCFPSPCHGVGACCVGSNCLQLTSAECIARNGIYMGEGMPCEEVSCVVSGCGGGLFTLAELGIVGDLSNQPGPVAASTGPGSGTLVESEDRGNCGTLLFNANGTYENGYAWRYGGITPPCFGAFAECYTGATRVCSVSFDFSAIGTQDGQSMDIYIFNDVGGFPGPVVASLRVTPGPVALWPGVSRHSFALSSDCTANDWWVGYWGDWPGQIQGWFVGADLDGFGGCSATNVAPGIGYPTGWHDVSVIWGPTQALGIGAEVNGCTTSVIDSSWGRIKRLFH
jgi:hypothetical protein